MYVHNYHSFFFAPLSGLGEGGREVLIALSAAVAEAVILRTPATFSPLFPQSNKQNISFPSSKRTVGHGCPTNPGWHCFSSQYFYFVSKIPLCPGEIFYSEATAAAALFFSRSEAAAVDTAPFPPSMGPTLPLLIINLIRFVGRREKEGRKDYSDRRISIATIFCNVPN